MNLSDPLSPGQAIIACDDHGELIVADDVSVSGLESGCAECGHTHTHTLATLQSHTGSRTRPAEAGNTTSEPEPETPVTGAPRDTL